MKAGETEALGVEAAELAEAMDEAEEAWMLAGVPVLPQGAAVREPVGADHVWLHE